MKGRRGTPRPAADSDDQLELEVRTQLERLLASKEFRASERRRNLLTYVVESSLSGAADQLKGPATRGGEALELVELDDLKIYYSIVVCALHDGTTDTRGRARDRS